MPSRLIAIGLSADGNRAYAQVGPTDMRAYLAYQFTWGRGTAESDKPH